jgi:hypothetical protein
MYPALRSVGEIRGGPCVLKRKFANMILSSLRDAESSMGKGAASQFVCAGEGVVAAKQIACLDCLG